MIGGMEKLSFALAKEFSQLVDTTTISWGKSQKYLPYFILLAFIKACFLIPRKKINHIHIGDALLSPLGLALKVIFGIKTTVTVAGLDITFDFPGYQFIIPKCVARFDTVICISNATREECIKRGVPANKCIVIPCGVYSEDLNITTTRKDLNNIVGKDMRNKKVLITVGRLVKRKGVSWFLENVFMRLDKNYVYLIIGGGPEEESIHNTINTNKLNDRVFLLGKISDEKLKIIYHTADLFVMPNIKVDNNMEGFGIVAIEASSTGLPVIASDMEGISNAVINGKTGRLVKSKNIKAFMEAIKSKIKFNKTRVSITTKENFSWNVIGKMYIKNFSL
jgi:glycosyltransferase involved in cell wall biosynthesis